MLPARKTLEALDEETAFYFWFSSAPKEIVHCTSSFQTNKIATMIHHSPGGMNLQDLEHREPGSCIQKLMKALSVSTDKIVTIQRLD